MAALSSSTESGIKTVRLTYQELLELADSLDNEKKKKSPKRKSKENLEEKDSIIVVSPSKDERSSVDNEEEREAVVLETKTDSKITEKRTKEEKKSSKKKGEEKKKHRSRSHSDEKRSEREDDDEVGSQYNKEKREKTTKDEKTQNYSTGDSLNVDNEDKVKGKEERKSSRKRSPKLKEVSGEKTADLEDHVAKLRLDTHGEEEEENSRKAIKSTKKKAKSNEEKDKKHSESKKKDKKKSEKSKKDSLEEEGNEKETRKRKKDKIEIDDNCLEDEHRKHGILKSSAKMKGNHVHVSFSEDVVDSHSSESNTALPSEERGIIRIPEGIDIHHDERKIRGSAEFEECLENDYHHDINDDHDDEIFCQDISQTTERPEDMLHGKVLHDNNNPDGKTSDEGKISTMEKRLKALNRQRAQQLIKQCRHAENSLSNLLSKGISDKGSLHKVCTLSKEIQHLYQGVIMLDLGLAHQHDVDQLLWKNAFYQVIETFRKYGKLFLGYSNQKNTMSPEEINNELYQFLETASDFYNDLLEGLQKTNHFEVQDIVNQPRQAEMLGRNVSVMN